MPSLSPAASNAGGLSFVAGAAGWIVASVVGCGETSASPSASDARAPVSEASPAGTAESPPGTASVSDSGSGLASEHDGAAAATQDAGSADASLPGYTLTWSDEFNGPNGSAVDGTKWTYDTGGGGWGNSELEDYTSGTSNAVVEDGDLVITAARTCAVDGGCTYTSARLLTQGKFTQKYGRFEARIRIPFGQGLWPAFWILGDDIAQAGWPACGEIDIMENIGKEPANVHGSLHAPGFSGSGLTGTDTLAAGGRFADAFHTFAIDWNAGGVRFFVDDQLYETQTPADAPSGSTWAFDHPFFILLNVAVGGTWPGNPDNTTTFPQTMNVDWVRVYEKAP